MCLCVNVCVCSTQWFPEATKDNKEKTAQEIGEIWKQPHRKFLEQKKA